MENSDILSDITSTTDVSKPINSEENFLSKLNFSNRYYKLMDNYQYQLPTELKNPYIININPLMAKELDIDHISIDHKLFAKFTCGNLLLEGSDPIASIYAGHQFGHFVPQLGDGRALLLGEIKNKHNRYWELQLKGAGKTPFSRDGDGRAVLRSTIREYLCSEAMAGLGIETTRSLSMVGSTEEVYRETIERGSVMVRMSPSFIRFGSFELFASRGQDKQIKQLADFVIEHYYPEINTNSNPNPNPYQQFLQQVVVKTAKLMAHWQSVGFSHGVMNTDNMSILGLTLDYGPFGFLDNYDPQFICNHSDHQGRYRFENQPYIGFWNLNCLAKALMSLISLDEAKQALSQYQSTFRSHYIYLMQQKLGLFNSDHQQYDQQYENLIESLLKLLQEHQIDYTLFFRRLSNYRQSSDVAQSCPDVLEMFTDQNSFNLWLEDYSQALQQQSFSCESKKIKMDMINPKYILRNYIAQIIIEKVDQEKDYGFIDKWLKILQSPYDEHPEMEIFAGLPPSWAEKISVSCSS